MKLNKDDLEDEHIMKNIENVNMKDKILSMENKLDSYVG